MSKRDEVSMTAYERAFWQIRQSYQDHLPLIQHLQADLERDADEIKAESGWDVATCKGIDAWVNDPETVFRFLHRNGWNADKAYPILLDALSFRAVKNLHLPIPTSSPYSHSDLFYILPLPHHVDRVGRPICVLTCRSILRTANGGLDDLTEWVWWACETLRRTLSDYWHGRKWGGKKGYGGEGCAVVVDAAGAGYRNLEVELLPNLARIGSKNFPGLIQNIFVVNAGWTQRSLWKVVRPILPSHAIEKIRFIDYPSQLSEFFELDQLPAALGGTSTYSFSAGCNPILNHYSTHTLISSTAALSEIERESEGMPTRNASFASTAEVFYTASNTPLQSRRGSISKQNDGLRMTKSFHVLPTSGMNAREARPPLRDDVCPTSPTDTMSGHSTPVAGETRLKSATASIAGSTTSAGRRSRPGTLSSAQRTGESSMTPLQRIRSLADFKLYLSPSRRAQVELLNSDSEEDETPRRSSGRPLIRSFPDTMPQRRRILRPVAFEPGKMLSPQTLSDRRARPPLRLLEIPNHVMQTEEYRRSYSDLLVRHHAEELQKLDGLPQQLLRQQSSAPQAIPDNLITHHEDPLSSPSLVSSGASSSQSIIANGALETTHDTAVRISAFSRSRNPYYGYPAVRLPSPHHPGHMSIQPAYSRRRKRDLVRTLLFLFLLRLQSLRESIERAMGLNRLLPWTGGASDKFVKANNPAEGLMRTYTGGEGKVVKRTMGSDWFWTIITLALVRGGWVRVLAWPLELLGLQGVKDALGV